MKEDAGIGELLERLKTYDLTPLERIILCNEGTVQSLLSMLFMVPVEVEVISQLEESGVIIRWTKLVANYAPDNRVTVCLAESVIPIEKNSTGFINGIREKQWGIGMLLEGVGVQTTREILGIYADEQIFSRTYRILGAGRIPAGVHVSSGIMQMRDDRADIIITEVFPKAVYKKLEGL